MADEKPQGYCMQCRKDVDMDVRCSLDAYDKHGLKWACVSVWGTCVECGGTIRDAEIVEDTWGASLGS